jgi:hypothetical protein
MPVATPAPLKSTSVEERDVILVVMEAWKGT